MKRMEHGEFGKTKGVAEEQLTLLEPHPWPLPTGMTCSHTNRCETKQRIKQVLLLFQKISNYMYIHSKTESIID